MGSGTGLPGFETGSASVSVTPRGQGSFSAVLLATPSREQDGVHHTSHRSTVSAVESGERVHLLLLPLFIRKSKVGHTAGPPAAEAGRAGIRSGPGRR